MSPRKFEKNTLNRFEINEAQKKRSLDSKRIKKLTKEKKELSSKKSPNKIPDHIAENPPLYNRTDYVLWDKEHKILVAQQIQNARKNKDFMKNCTFNPDLLLTHDYNEGMKSHREHTH